MRTFFVNRLNKYGTPQVTAQVTVCTSFLAIGWMSEVTVKIACGNPEPA